MTENKVTFASTNSYSQALYELGNESGSLQGDIGAQPAPDNGCNSSQGQPGETGGAGGEWALKGADTNNTGDGGAPGRAIAGTSYSVIGSISATTIKGDYPATP